MRITIFGAGAMGTLLGHRFCRTDHEVAILDLPDRIEQLRELGGLRVTEADGMTSEVMPACLTDSPGDLKKPDVVFLATKSQDLPQVADDLSTIGSSDATIVTIQNGIPWWYLHNLAGEYCNRRIECLDPFGSLEKEIEPSQIVGCVAYPAAELLEDGTVQHVEGWRFPVGEIDAAARPRTECVAALFQESGFKSRVIDDIRSEIWLKAWGALSINPVSALTGATMEHICSFPMSRELIATMMLEAQHVAEKLGAKFRHTIEKRIEGARSVGPHKTSMLQDVERGRPLELDALMLAVLELADMVGEQTPTIRTVYMCTALLNDRLVS